jgi:hypothetical protein
LPAHSVANPTSRDCHCARCGLLRGPEMQIPLEASCACRTRDDCDVSKARSRARCASTCRPRPRQAETSRRYLCASMQSVQTARKDARPDAVRPVTETDEHDYEDTITRHEYEHEHAYEYDARRYDYDRAQLTCVQSRGRPPAFACKAASPEPITLPIVIVSSCVVRVLVLVLVPRNRVFVIVLDPFRPGIPTACEASQGVSPGFLMGKQA